MAPRKDKVPTNFMTAKAVMEEFGGISDMTLARWLADENISFPQPIYIKRRRYFDIQDIEGFKRRALAGEARSRARRKE